MSDEIMKAINSANARRQKSSKAKAREWSGRMVALMAQGYNDSNYA
jgi:hypothetical protein